MGPEKPQFDSPPQKKYRLKIGAFKQENVKEATFNAIDFSLRYRKTGRHDISSCMRYRRTRFSFSDFSLYNHDYALKLRPFPILPYSPYPPLAQAVIITNNLHVASGTASAGAYPDFVPLVQNSKYGNITQKTSILECSSVVEYQFRTI